MEYKNNNENGKISIHRKGNKLHTLPGKKKGKKTVMVWSGSVIRICFYFLSKYAI